MAELCTERMEPIRCLHRYWNFRYHDTYLTRQYQPDCDTSKVCIPLDIYSADLVTATKALSGLHRFQAGTEE